MADELLQSAESRVTSHESPPCSDSEGGSAVREYSCIIGWRNLAGIMLVGIKKTENVFSASCELSVWEYGKAQIARGVLCLKEGAMNAGASEFVGNDGGAFAAQEAADNGEEGRNEGLFEHAVAGKDEVSGGLDARLEQNEKQDNGGEGGGGGWEGGEGGGGADEGGASHAKMQARCPGPTSAARRLCCRRLRGTHPHSLLSWQQQQQQQ